MDAAQSLAAFRNLILAAESAQLDLPECNRDVISRARVAYSALCWVHDDGEALPAVGTTPATSGNLEPHHLTVPEIPLGEYPYAFGWLSMAYCQLFERLDRLVALPCDKRTLILSLTSIRDEMTGDFDSLSASIDRYAAAAKGGV